MNVIPFTFGDLNLKVRVDSDGEPWFHANTICGFLAYANPRDALSEHVNKEDVAKYDTLTAGGRQLANFVNESGLYALILGSKKDEAKRFKHWVTHDVLPALRKTGEYSAVESTTEPQLVSMLQDSLNLLKEAQAQNSKLISLLTAGASPAAISQVNLPYLVGAKPNLRRETLLNALASGPIVPHLYADATGLSRERVMSDVYELRVRGARIKTSSDARGTTYELA